MKIELTKEQIELLIKSESEVLQKKFDADVKALEKQLSTDVKALENKFKYVEVNVVEPAEAKKKTKINTDELKQMVADKVGVKKIAEHFGTTEQSIRSKLWHLKVKLT